MKIQTTRSFDELMKAYYGVAGAPELSNTAKVEALVSDYYGRPYERKARIGKCKSPAAAVSLSLAQDDGELLKQPAQETQLEEYVVQKSPSNEAFEEYVVSDFRRVDERAVAASRNIAPVESVNVAREYQVDVFEPLRSRRIPSPKLLAPARDNGSYRPTESASVREQSVSSYTPASDETDHAKPSEEDFIADMKSILSGKSVYDAASGKTVEKDLFARGQSREQDQSDERAFTEPDKAQAIFDRIAQSMQYANAYDLGTVELENRFADFDRISDLQQRAGTARKANKPEKKSAPSPINPVAKVDSEDFIRDLDAIRNARPEATSNAENKSPALDVTPPKKDVDPGSAPFALSLSFTDNPADFSRPLYDTGEHVLSGWDIYSDQLHVGKTPGVLFSYGQLIAMPDLFESVEQMMETDVNELQRLKALIEDSTNYYRGKMRGQPDPDLDVSNDRWQEATHERYLKLAEDNYEHFSPSPVFNTLPSINTSRGDNKSAWERHHRLAIEAAQQIYLAPGNAEATVFLEMPLIINAFGDHYLTDAFASGHLINKEATMAYFKAKFFNGNSLTGDAQTFFDKVADKAFTGKVKTEFSKLETAGWKGFPGVHPDIDRATRFASVLKAVAEQEPDQIGNLAVKALHDRLNKDGIAVTNNAGSGTWTLHGDQRLEQTSLEIIRKAVQQSIDNVNDPSVRATNLNLDTYFEKVWQFVPQLTSSSLVTVEQLTVEYTNPRSQSLIDAAAQIITDQVGLLIEKLKDADALRSNKSGWFPNVL
jgi:hypothetical protein